MTVELVKPPFLYLFKPKKVGWSDYGRRGLRKGGRNCLKYLKGDGTEKMGGETKILKREGKLGQRMGALKKGRGTGIPL